MVPGNQYGEEPVCLSNRAKAQREKERSRLQRH